VKRFGVFSEPDSFSPNEDSISDIHVKIHPRWNTHENGTFSAGNVVYTGQFFFDDDINIQIDKVSF
jgi:hypothetical protein